jgi:hypothetical protein
MSTVSRETGICQRRLKLCYTKTYYGPILKYGAQIWPWTKRDVSRENLSKQYKHQKKNLMKLRVWKNRHISHMDNNIIPLSLPKLIMMNERPSERPTEERYTKESRERVDMKQEQYLQDDMEKNVTRCVIS